MSSHVFIDSFSGGSGTWMMPALLTRMSTGPTCCSISCAAFHCVLVGNVCDPSAPTDFAGHRVNALIPVHQNDFRAARGKFPAAGRADSARAPGDHCDSVES